MIHRTAAFAVTIACVAGLPFLVRIPIASAQTPGPNTPVYNPYPPGLLPPDLQSETVRVMGEIDHLEQEAMSQWQMLPQKK